MVMRVDDKRVVPDNTDIPERVLNLFAMSFAEFGVETTA